MKAYLYNNLPHVIGGAAALCIGGFNVRTLLFAVIYVATMSYIMRAK